MRAREVPAIAATMVNEQERAFVVVFGSPLFSTRERCVVLRVIVVNGARHTASADEKKNHMRRHTIFCTTVVTYGR